MQAMLDQDEAVRAGNGRASQLPVLFHLMDVSRPRPSQAVPMAAESSSSKSAGMPSPDVEPAYPSLAPAASGVLGSESTHVAPSILSTSSAFPPIVPLASPESAPAIAPAVEHSPQPATVASSLPSAPETTVSESLTPTALQSSPAGPTDSGFKESAATELVGQAKEPIATATQRSSRRKSKRPASEDWFASHGKFIAVAFVLALLGTIYFARTNRRQPIATAEKSIADAESAQSANDKSFDARPVDRTTGYRVTNNASNFTPIESPSNNGESKAELHPPTTPQLASADSAGDKDSAADNLFVFPAKKGDERMAVRPDTATTGGGSTIQHPTSGGATSNGPSGPGASPVATTGPDVTPVYPTTSQPAPPRTNSPATSVYPVTGAPPVVAPAAIPAPGTSPTNQAPAGAAPGYSPPNYRSQYPAPTGVNPPSAQAWSPPAPGGGLPSQYQPSDTTARGQRYERTGSGNY